MELAKKPLTKSQAKVLDFVRKRIQETDGLVPSLKEIAGHFGYRSLNSAKQQLQLIEKKGYLERIPGMARGIRVIDVNERIPPPDGVPLVGSIAAGVPILAEENILEWLELPRNLFPNQSALFALRVTGESMRNAGIRDGDTAIIRKQPVAENGSIVAIRFDDEATLKTLVKANKMTILRAANPDFEDIMISPNHFPQPVIEGVLAGILRTY